MKKMMLFMLIFVGILFGGVFALKWFEGEKKVEFIKKNSVHIATVSATQAKLSQWRDHIEVTGNMRTVRGVDITTEAGGMVEKIAFKPGSDVKKGDLLAELDIHPDVALLHKLQAQARFAKTTYQRDKKQYAFGAVSKEQLDSDESNYKSTEAQVKEQQATIAKKIIRAPFSGRLGIRYINLGQYVNPGDKIVNIQSLDPIYCDFYIPQQYIPRLNVGMPVKIDLDSTKGTTFTGELTTINPIVDETVRNVEVEATLNNSEYKLLPGMFVNVTLKTGEPKTYITLPQMAVTFNPYGSIVYILHPTSQKTKGSSENQVKIDKIIKQGNKDLGKTASATPSAPASQADKPLWKVQQTFVTTGPTRGNQIAILKGVKAGDKVVTSGQLKIKDGSLVTINNTVMPSDTKNPQPSNELSG